MARRFSGDVDVRITFSKGRKGYKSRNGHNADSKNAYKGSVSAPGYNARGQLSAASCGIWPWQDEQSAESYDKAARAFIALADKEAGIGKHANYENGKLQILRVQQAPCPVSASSNSSSGSPSRAPTARKGSRKSATSRDKKHGCCSACIKGLRCNKS